MSAQSFTKIQLATNYLLLFLLSLIGFLIPLAAAGVFAVAAPDNEPLSSWWLRVIRDVHNWSPGRAIDILLVAILSLAIVIFELWLARRFADEKRWPAIPVWVHLVSGVIAGMLARDAWRGIWNARFVRAEKTRIVADKRWLWVSFIAGCVTAVGCGSLVVLSFAPSGPGHDALFANVFLASFVGAFVFFPGLNRALRRPSN